ncbi:major facilitator superfamily domain-containing protein [Mycena floridula]|nr:major facilitator superfamily domain-containing protein [Mycena floridula]
MQLGEVLYHTCCFLTLFLWPNMSSVPSHQSHDSDVLHSSSEKTNGQDQGTGKPVDSFEEGGLRGWLAVFGGALVTFCTFGVVQSFGVFQDYYQRVYLTQHTPSEISWIGSVQTFFLFTVGLFSGKLFDAGYFHHSVISGAVLYLFSLFMLSLAKPDHYVQNFLAQGCGMGIGMGLMFLPCLSLTSHYFRRRRSLAMGCVVAGSSVGAVLYPILLNNLFGKMTKHSFGSGVRAMGYLDLGVLLLANLMMRTRPRVGPKKATPIAYKEVMSDKPYLIFCLGSFLVFWGIFVPFFYLQNYAALHAGVPRKLVTYSLSILNCSSILGRTIPNFLADQYGALNVMIPSAFISAGLIWAMIGATNVPGVVLFGIFYGIFSGSCISICTPAASRFATRADLSDLGARIGILSFCLGFALLSGNPIAGALLTPERFWIRPLIFASVVTCAGGICYIFAWRLLTVRKKTRYV